MRLRFANSISKPSNCLGMVTAIDTSDPKVGDSAMVESGDLTAC
jgi:hypothetical protein